MGGCTGGLHQGVQEEVVTQCLSYQVLWPLMAGVLSWGLYRGCPLLSLSLPPQLVFPLCVLCPLCLLHTSLMEEFPSGLTDAMQHTGCNDDPMEVVLRELEACSEG